jgi:hypothetical protein
MRDKPNRIFSIERIDAADYRSERRFACEVCGGGTREGKPFCPEHVEQSPYVQSVVNALRAADDEIARVEKNGWQSVNIKGTKVAEILLHLRMHGSRTLDRLLREVFIGCCTKKAARAYITALERHGLVSVSITQRRGEMVHLTEKTK